MQRSTIEPEISTNFSVKKHLNSDSGKWFSDELAVIFQWITFSTMCQAVALFGVGSNIINIICFIKQGFKDPVNVSFLGLALADLSSLVTIIWTNLGLTPAFVAADLPFEPIQFQHLVSAVPHFAFTRISSWITALITLERCLCIIAPIKVKSIVTPKRVSVILICVFATLMSITCPIYFVNKLDWKFFPAKNKSLIGVVYVGDRETIENICYTINNACIPFGSFAVTTVCTIILVIQLQKKSKWRKASTVSTQADNVSTRNEKVAKMVVMISGLFIVCFTPMCVIFIVISLVPSISVSGKQRNVIFVFSGFGTLLESGNSAVNIFIYYDMSSKYRAVFKHLYCFCQKKSDKIIEGNNSKHAKKVISHQG